MSFASKAEDVKRAALMLGHVLEFSPHSIGGLKGITNQMWGKSRFVLICDRCKKSVILEYTNRTTTEAMLPSIFSVECSGPPQWSAHRFGANTVMRTMLSMEMYDYIRAEMKSAGHFNGDVK